LKGAGRVHVGVHLAHYQEEFARELVGVLDIGTAAVGFVYGPTQPLLVPPDLVHAVVVAPAVGDGHLVEVPVVQQTSQSVLSAGAAAVETNAAKVHPGT